MTEARLQTKLETNSTDAKEQNTRAAAEQARSILYYEAWWFLRWYCFVRSHLTKETFPYTKRVLINRVFKLHRNISVRNIWFLAPESIWASASGFVSGNPTFSTTSHRTTTSAGVDFWRVWNLEWTSFCCFVFLFFSTRCVFFCVCAFSLLSFVVVCMSFCFLPRVCSCLVYSYCFFYIYWSVFCFSFLALFLLRVVRVVSLVV